jgi:hypothetical protein
MKMHVVKEDQRMTIIKWNISDCLFLQFSLDHRKKYGPERFAKSITCSNCRLYMRVLTACTKSIGFRRSRSRRVPCI